MNDKYFNDMTELLFSSLKSSKNDTEAKNVLKLALMEVERDARYKAAEIVGGLHDRIMNMQYGD